MGDPGDPKGDPKSGSPTYLFSEFIVEYLIANTADRVSPWLKRVGKKFNQYDTFNDLRDSLIAEAGKDNVSLKEKLLPIARALGIKEKTVLGKDNDLGEKISSKFNLFKVQHISILLERFVPFLKIVKNVTHPTKGESKGMGDFDFIVVGTNCVALGLLSEDAVTPRDTSCDGKGGKAAATRPLASVSSTRRPCVSSRRGTMRLKLSPSDSAASGRMSS